MSDDRASSGPSSSSEPLDLGLESGLYESPADSGQAWVRRDSTGEAVRATITAYPPDFVFEPGDETGIELVDGVWHAIPSVVQTVRLKTRTEWWTRNRRTGDYRLLAERHLDMGQPR